MAHLALKSDHLALQKRLDKNPIGAPAHPALTAILEELFTAEECRVAAAMPLKLSTAGKIAAGAGMSPKRTGEILATLLQKGLVVDLQRGDGAVCWFLNPTMVGFFEFTMMRKRDDIDQKKVALLMHEYLSNNPEMGFVRMLSEGPTYLGRPLVHEEALDSDVFSEVLDWEKASSVVGEAGSWAEGLCHCRHVAHHLERDCKKMPMDHCLGIGMGAEYLVRAGIARRIDRVRAMEILAESKEAGCVQMCDNVKNRPTFICNCCKCCCGMMEHFRTLPQMSRVVSSNHVACADEINCTGCGRCLKACPINCIDLVPAGPTEKMKNRKKRAVVNGEMCLGCGVCHRDCKSGSMTLKRTAARVYTPETAMERMMAQALERGRLQNMLFDDQTKVTHRTLGLFLGAILNLPPAKRALADSQLKSKFVKTMLDGFSRTKNGWMARV